LRRAKRLFSTLSRSPDECKTFVSPSKPLCHRFVILFQIFLFHLKRDCILNRELNGYLDINLKALLLPRHFQIFTRLADTPGNDDFVNKIIVYINPEFELHLIKLEHADDMWVFGRRH